MANPLIARVRPKDLAKIGQSFEFKGKLSDFARLAEIVEADLAEAGEQEMPQRWRQAPVDIRLRFAWADDGHTVPSISGRVLAHIPAVCQRCLRVFELPLDTELRLLVVAQGESVGIAGYEAWEQDEDDLSPLEVIEESLVMALPLAAMHETADGCAVQGAGSDSSGTDRIRPFADLRAQIDGTDD